MEFDLKEELARIRAREKRYKDTAEARIVELEKQLAAMKEAEDKVSSTVADLETRCRLREEENAALQNRATSLQTQLEAIKAHVKSADADKATLESRCRQRENEIAQLKKQVETSSTVK